ncbi:MAG: cytochrome c-type biogenesis protein CcmH [Brevefilum sp.]|nr:cytochrome c-type biogenesis protein CcmH [Brevefilum sp.]
MSGLILVDRVQASTPSDDEVNRIASQLFCPICDNIPLDVCPIEACQQWRELIREQLAEGWTEGEIKAYFVAQYGDRVLGEPPRAGLNWLLYLAPPVVFLVGFILLLAKMKRQPQRPDLQGRAHKDPYLEQVERDLANLDQTS